MWSIFLASLSPMMVVLVCISIGYVLHKVRILPENAAAVLSKLEINVFLPAFIINIFVNHCTVESLTGQYKMVLYGVISVVLGLIIGIPLSLAFSKDKNTYAVYRYSLVTANFGFLGNSVVPMILGSEATYTYILFTIPWNIMLYAWAFNTLIPQGQEKQKNVLQRLCNPGCISLAIGMALGLLGVGKVLPGFVRTTLDNLSGCMGPIAMILTGFVIGSYRLPELLKNKKVYIVTFLRLLVLPAVIMGIMWLLGADKNILAMSMFATGSALGLNSVVVPAAYGGDSRTGASMAMISHVGAVLTIPLLYAALQLIVG